MHRLLRFIEDRRGSVVVEYALICALVILTMLVALNTTASRTVRMFNNVSANAGAVL